MEFNAQQFLFRAFSHTIRIFGSIETQTESAFPFQYNVIYQTYTWACIHLGLWDDFENINIDIELFTKITPLPELIGRRPKLMGRRPKLIGRRPKLIGRRPKFSYLLW